MKHPQNGDWRKNIIISETQRPSKTKKKVLTNKLNSKQTAGLNRIKIEIVEIEQEAA